MANAIKKSVPIIQLTLTEEEAIVLASLFQFVGGDEQETVRGIIDNISTALDDVVSYNNHLFSGELESQTRKWLKKDV